MIAAVVLALGLFGSQKATIEKTTTRLSGWTLSVRKDNFVGSTSCTARRAGVILQNAVVQFSLGRWADTSEAEYRLDAGPAHSIRDVALRVRVLGAPVTAEPIDNPSRGLVVLPESDLAGADSVWIRATPKSAPRRFVITGLSDVVAQERVLACAKGL